MGKSGFNLCQEGHYVSLFDPADHTTAASSEVFSMRGWSHVSIIVHVGVGSACTIELEECTSFAASTVATFVPYWYAAEGTADGDTLSNLAAGTTAGVAIDADTTTVLIFEVDAEALSDGYQYIRITHTANTASIFGAIAILSGGRFQEDGTSTQIV